MSGILRPNTLPRKENAVMGSVVPTEATQPSWQEIEKLAGAVEDSATQAKLSDAVSKVVSQERPGAAGALIAMLMLKFEVCRANGKYPEAVSALHSAKTIAALDLSSLDEGLTCALDWSRAWFQNELDGGAGPELPEHSEALALLKAAQPNSWSD